MGVKKGKKKQKGIYLSLQRIKIEKRVNIRDFGDRDLRVKGRHKRGGDWGGRREIVPPKPRRFACWEAWTTTPQYVPGARVLGLRGSPSTEIYDVTLTVSKASLSRHSAVLPPSFPLGEHFEF